MRNKHIFTFYAIALAALFLILVLGFARPKPISSLTQKQKFWAEKTHSNKTYDIIFLGDSRLYRGIDPKTISIELQGLKVLNFGYSSGGQNKMVFEEATKRLNKVTQTKAVVLVLTPYSLTPKAQENNHLKQEADRKPEEVFQRRYINPFLSFFDPIKPTDIMKRRDSLPGYYEDFRKHGWVASKKIPADSEQALESYVKNFKGNRVEDFILENLYIQIEKWRDQDVQVFAFRMPSTRKMETLENSLSGYDEVKIKDKLEKSGGEWITIENRYGYKSYDGSHLEESSAIQFSKYLGQELYKRLNY